VAVVLADEALDAAARVAMAAGDAGAALAGLGVRDAFTPARFGDLAALTGALDPPEIPLDAHPDERAAWWVSLPATVQRNLIRRDPAAIGALDGLPAWARDRANRLVLGRALTAAEPSGTARAVADEIAAQERAGRPAQLHLFDEAGERAAVVLGDLDRASAVVLLVPGISTTPDDDLDAVTADVARVLDVAAALDDDRAADGDGVAAHDAGLAGVAWLGYRPPRGLGILRRSAAERAGPLLDAALDGQAAVRSAAGLAAARTTVVAHSYGTVVVDEAADAPGRLAADALVLLGSPGMELDRTPLLEVPEVHDAASIADPVSWSAWFGVSTWARRYGAAELPVGPGTGHSDYFDHGGPTLPALGAVVTGGERPG
jgi:hypothetical protein